MADLAHSTPTPAVERRPEAATSGAGRRSTLLATLAGLVAAPSLAAAVPCPDAGLIRLARAHADLGRQYNADFPEVDSDDDPRALAAEARRNRISEQQAEILDAMMRMQPTTLAGFQAVATALAVEDLEMLKPRFWHHEGNRLVALLVAGLLGRDLAPAPATIPTPAAADAELHRLCAEWQHLHHESYTLPDKGARTWEQAMEDRWGLSDQLQPLRPATQAGRLAKAQIALALLEEDTEHGTVTNGSTEDFVLATLRDLVGADA